jgi:hypothetical protein
MKTSELIGPALDWAVAKCEGYDRQIRLNKHKEWEDLGRTQVRDDDYTMWNPSEDWAQGGPIIEREKVIVDLAPNGWCCMLFEDEDQIAEEFGPTPLIAAMRCFCVSKLGDEVDIPKELL